MMPGSAMVRSMITENPVVRREARLRFWRHWSRGRKVAVVVGATAAASLLALALRGLVGGMDPSSREAIMICYALMLAIIPALIGARTVAGEREVRTWEQLLITRLRPVHLICGKIIGVILPVALIVLLTAPGLWILLLHFDQALPVPAILEMLFAPAGLAQAFYGHATAYYGSYQNAQVGLFWWFATAMLWIVQGATVGVFASLRYRSTVSSAVVAVLLLSVVIGLDLVFLSVGGFGFAQDPSVLSSVELALISALVVWGWPLITIAIMIGLATYEFRDFDLWLQSADARAGR